MGEATDLADLSDLNPHRHAVGKQKAAQLLTWQNCQRLRDWAQEIYPEMQAGKGLRTGGMFESL